MAEDASGAPEPNTVADLRADLERSRGMLMDAIAGLDEEAFRQRVAPGRWTAAEMLVHLLGSERMLLSDAETALNDNTHTVTPRTDAAREEEARQAQRMPVPQIIHALLAQRRDALRQFDALSIAQLEGPLHHPTLGQTNVAWLFRKLAEHDREHAEDIGALRATVAPR